MRASQLGALNDLAQAAIEFEEVAWRLALPGMRAVRLLERALRQLGQAEDKTRGKLQSSMVRALVFAEMPDQASRLHRQTVQLARRVGDPETLEAALRSGFWLRWDPGDLEDWLAAADEAVALAQQIRSKERVLDAVAFRIHLRVAVGDLHGFSSDLERFAQLADELHQPFHQYHGTSLRAAHALLTGRYSDAETLARGAAKLGTRLPGLDASGAFGMQMFTLAQECGELAQLAPVVRELLRTTPHAGIWRPALALVLAELGQVEEARTELEQLAPQQFQAIARDSLWLACLVYLTQVCALIQEQTHAEVLYALLGPWKGRNVVAGSVAVCYGPADHFLGMLSANLRRWDAAERHFTAAVEMNQRQGSRPWLAHAQYQHAAMLAERGKRGDHQRARVLLASARELTDELQMVTLGQRLSQLERRLDAHPQKPSYPGGLSRREAQVLRLVAAGKSNQEIADAMFRSPNTVANHVRSILTKLGAANRTEAATVAARHGLL
jgi:DNA-binding CsgD family transcriptional regulator